MAEVSEVGEGQDVGRRRLEPGAMAAFRDCRQGDVRGECFFSPVYVVLPARIYRRTNMWIIIPSIV